MKHTIHLRHGLTSTSAGYSLVFTLVSLLSRGWLGSGHLKHGLETRAGRVDGIGESSGSYVTPA